MRKDLFFTGKTASSCQALFPQTTEEPFFVFNMSDRDVVRAFGVPGSCPHEVLSECANVISPVAKELLDKLREIHSRGYVKGVSHGDTNVGMTLESLLEIPPNDSKAPDYKGIELKSSRKLGKAAARTPKAKKVTLFTNTPDWKRSKFDAEGILKTFGYVGDNSRLQLYCTVSNLVNAQGLYLDAHDEIDLINKAKTPSYVGDVAVWALDTLKARQRRVFLKNIGKHFGFRLQADCMTARNSFSMRQLQNLAIARFCSRWTRVLRARTTKRVRQGAETWMTRPKKAQNRGLRAIG